MSFDINQLNGITIDTANLANFSVSPPSEAPTTGDVTIGVFRQVPSAWNWSLLQTHTLEGSSFPSYVSDLGKITVLDSTVTPGAYVPGGYTTIAGYQLPTFGEIEFANVQDQHGNPITFYVHGFTENGLLLTTNAIETSSTTPSFLDNTFVVGVYGFYSDGGTNPGHAQFSPDPETFDAALCFAEGTRIETVSGPVAVEALSVGDLVLTASGEQRAVKWIGDMVIRPGTRRRPWEVNPVRVAAHAFGHNVPARDVRLSPGHAVYVDGVLVPVGKLVNGATIVQEEVGQIRYFHVELDTHDVLLSEGLPCESYLNDGNRLSFRNAGEFARLHGRLDPKSWDDACAPMVADGPQLVTIRERLHAQAEALGWVKSEEPDLVIEADGVAVMPLHRSGSRYWFSLPAAKRLVLRSNHGVLAHVMPDLKDGRKLGVAVAEVRVDGKSLDLDAAAFGQGFYQTERHEEHGWRWTNGAAELSHALAHPAMIEVSVIMVAPSWKRAVPALRVVA